MLYSCTHMPTVGFKGLIGGVRLFVLLSVRLPVSGIDVYYKNVTQTYGRTYKRTPCLSIVYVVHSLRTCRDSNSNNID